MRFLELVGLNAIFPHNTRAGENRQIYRRQCTKDYPPSKQLKSINNITEACEKGHRFWARNNRGYVPGRTREGAIIRCNGANVQDGMYVLGKTYGAWIPPRMKTNWSGGDQWSTVASKTL